MNGTFPENIKYLREPYHFSQAELAERVQVSQQCVSKWERNKIEPTLTNLWMIADLFDLTVDEIMGRKTGNSNNKPCPDRL